MKLETKIRNLISETNATNKSRFNVNDNLNLEVDCVPFLEIRAI
jgi:hypothetical protein